MDSTQQSKRPIKELEKSLNEILHLCMNFVEMNNKLIAFLYEKVNQLKISRSLF